MNDNAVIAVTNLSKSYSIGIDRGYKTLTESATNFFKHPISSLKSNIGQNSKFWALKEVTFSVNEGDIVGIIGRNGAGKSTLLKIISRITHPTKGEIRLQGKVGSLLEVGTGFHPELTGRENIFLSGSILGMKKNEIKNDFDEIVTFADVGEFLDTPVKRYSSGMQVRLAFSVAANLNPDILVVDEVLAVGDAQFQKKCLGKMSQISKSEGRTILFVSHNMSMISSLCKYGLLLEHGSLKFSGDVESTINHYLNSGSYGKGEIFFQDNNPGDKKVLLHSVRIFNKNGESKTDITINEDFFIEMEYELLYDGMRVYPNFHIKDAYGQYVFVASDTDIDPDCRLKNKKGKYKSKCTIPGNLLNTGTFYIGFAVGSVYPLHVHFHEQDLLFVTIHDPIDGIKTRLTGYSGPVPGTFRPLLKWDLEGPINN
jgi:lipopolysaccharide transport system ATP-binding protein